MTERPRGFMKTLLFCGMAAMLSGLLSFSSTGLQVARLGLRHVETAEVRAHRQAVERLAHRSAGTNFDYRVLPTLIVEAVDRSTGLGLSRTIVYSVFFARATALVLCFLVFRQLGLRAAETLLAVFYVYYATNVSFYNEGLNLYEPLNFLFFLVFFAFTVGGWDLCLLPTVALASLNKETAVMMPLWYLAYRWSGRTSDGESLLRRNGSKILYAAGMACISLAIYGLLRYALSADGLAVMERTAQRYGWGWTALRTNLTNRWVYLQWLIAFNALLILPLFYWSCKPAALKRVLVVFCPVYVAAHALIALLDEVRLFHIFLVVLLPLSIDTLRRAEKGVGL